MFEKSQFYPSGLIRLFSSGLIHLANPALLFIFPAFPHPSSAFFHFTKDAQSFSAFFLSEENPSPPFKPGLHWVKALKIFFTTNNSLLRNFNAKPIESPSFSAISHKLARSELITLCYFRRPSLGSRANQLFGFLVLSLIGILQTRSVCKGP